MSRLKASRKRRAQWQAEYAVEHKFELFKGTFAEYVHARRIAWRLEKQKAHQARAHVHAIDCDLDCDCTCDAAAAHARIMLEKKTKLREQESYLAANPVTTVYLSHE